MLRGPADRTVDLSELHCLDWPQPRPGRISLPSLRRTSRTALGPSSPTNWPGGDHSIATHAGADDLKEPESG